jgi:hypothetical protein
MNVLSVLPVCKTILKMYAQTAAAVSQEGRFARARLTGMGSAWITSPLRRKGYTAPIAGKKLPLLLIQSGTLPLKSGEQGSQNSQRPTPGSGNT